MEVYCSTFYCVFFSGSRGFWEWFQEEEDVVYGYEESKLAHSELMRGILLRHTERGWNALDQLLREKSRREDITALIIPFPVLGRCEKPSTQ